MGGSIFNTGSHIQILLAWNCGCATSQRQASGQLLAVGRPYCPMSGREVAEASSQHRAAKVQPLCAGMRSCPKTPRSLFASRWRQPFRDIRVVLLLSYVVTGANFNTQVLNSDRGFVSRSTGINACNFGISSIYNMGATTLPSHTHLASSVFFFPYGNFISTNKGGAIATQGATRNVSVLVQPRPPEGAYATQGRTLRDLVLVQPRPSDIDATQRSFNPRYLTSDATTPRPERPRATTTATTTTTTMCMCCPMRPTPMAAATSIRRTPP